MFKSSSELCDVISQSAYCPDDNSYMLTLESTTNEFWIPSSKIQPGSSWQAELLKDTVDIFGIAVQPTKVIRVCKVWLPGHASSCIYHCVYELKVNAELKKRSKSTFGKYRGKIRWVTDVELQKLLNSGNLKSPELADYYATSKAAGNRIEEVVKPATEFLYNGCFIELNDQMLVHRSTNMFEQLVEASGVNKDAQLSLYKEFLLMSFPALYLSEQHFAHFIVELGWSKEDTSQLFKAADINTRRGLSFREFMYFVCALEPGTSHGGGPAEVRCRYIFRFYDKDDDGALNFNEFKNMLQSVRKAKKQPIDAASIAQDAHGFYRTAGIANEKPIGMSEFLRAVGDLKLRGTSAIFRSTVSVQVYLRDINERDQKAQTKQLTKKLSIPTPDIKKSIIAVETGRSSQPKTLGYEIAMHSVRLQRSGTMIAVDQIWNISSAITFSSTNQPTLNDSARRVSIDQFSQKTISNEILKSLRYLTQVNKNRPTNPTKQGKKEPYNWGQLDPVVFGKNLITVCNQAGEILKQEPRMLEIASPVYVLGDLHGNFADLLYFERVLWHLGPCLCPCTLLFLGDYVDRGQFSTEVISYLLSYKVQGPAKVKLLRGNHEIREIQKMFTFLSECLNKFGDVLGQEVWNAVNNAFDVMPLAAIIDNKVFCCHGGIPPPWLCPVLSVINSIPVPLTQPDQQSSLAWELMWNDPVRNKNLTEAVTMELMANDGFAVNTRRGTAHIFATEALERFLNVNHLSHIIRAHEVAQSGFAVQQRGKLLTVFSSSKYCGGQNEAACVLADQNKLRILRLETC